MSTLDVKKSLKEIRQAIKDKEFQLAITKCKSILETEPNNYMALILLGAAYQEIDKKEAARYLRNAITCNSDPTLALQGLLNCAEIEELPEIIKKLLQLIPDKFNVYHNKLVDASTNSKNVDQCIEILKEETQIETHKESALRASARIFLNLTDVPEEHNDLLKASLESILLDVEIDIHMLSYKRYLKLLFKLSELKELLNHAIKMTELYPTETYPLEWLSKVYCENMETDIVSSLKNSEKPIEFYANKLLELNPISCMGLSLTAIQLYGKCQYVEARDVLMKVLKLQPNHQVAMKLLAKSNLAIGAYEMAANNYRQLQYEGVEFAECLSRSNNLQCLKKSVELLLAMDADEKVLECLAMAYISLDEKEKFQDILEQLNNIGSNKKASLLKAEFVLSPLEGLEYLKSVNHEDYDSLLLEGKLYYQLKNYESALTCYLKATRLRPYSAECFGNLGKVYVVVNDEIRAKKCFEKSISLNPLNESTVSHLGALYKKSEEWELNEAILQNALGQLQGSQTTWTHFQLGLHYSCVKKFDNAINSFRSALRFDVKKICYWEGLADSYAERGSYSSAMKVYQKIIEIDPSNYYAKLQIGLLKTTLHFFIEAIESLKLLLEEKPNFLPALKGIVDAHCGQANKLLSERLFGRAKDHFQMAVTYLEQAFLVGNRNMIWLFRLTADIFMKVVQFPVSKSYLFVSGNFMRKEEKLVQMTRKDLLTFARRYYTCAIKLNPNDTFLWYELSLCVYKYVQLFPDDDNAKNMELALQACKIAIKCQPSKWQNWNLLGVLNTTSFVNDGAMAQHCFIKSLQLERKSAVVWTNLGALYLNMDKIKLANQAFQRAQQSNPKYVNAWVGQAIIAEYIGEEEEAMDLFRHCTQLDFHLESALGYSYFVTTTLSNPDKLRNPRYKYAIENMHAVPVALDAINWFVASEGENSSNHALSYLGFLNVHEALYKSAVRTYQQAVNISNGDQRDKMFCNLGYSLLKNNQPVEAIEAFHSVSQASFKSTIGLALSHFRAKQLEESYGVYSSALQYLAGSDEEKSLILVAMAAMVYAFQGEEDTKTILYQCISLQNAPIQALYSAFALGILHKNKELCESILEELKTFENDPEQCHHVAFLTAQNYVMMNQHRQGLNYLLSRVHTCPDRPLLRNVLSEYIEENYDRMKKYFWLTSQMALSSITLGLREKKRQSSMFAAKSMVHAGKALQKLDGKMGIIYAQRAVHLNPQCKEAWGFLNSLKSQM